MGDGGASISNGAVIDTGDGDLLCGIPVAGGKGQGGRGDSGHAGIAAGGGDGDFARGLGIQYHSVGGGITVATGFGYGDTALGHSDAGVIIGVGHRYVRWVNAVVVGIRC